ARSDISWLRSGTTRSSTPVGWAGAGVPPLKEPVAWAPPVVLMNQGLLDPDATNSGANVCIRWGTGGLATMPSIAAPTWPTTVDSCSRSLLMAWKRTLKPVWPSAATRSTSSTQSVCWNVGVYLMLPMFKPLSDEDVADLNTGNTHGAGVTSG